MTRFALGTAALILAAAPALAVPVGRHTDIPGKTPACDRAEDRIACLSGLVVRSDARMRAALAKARAALAKSPTIAEAGTGAEALATLARTQRAWRAYVRARCEGEVPVAFTGGTGRNGAVLTCLRVHDARRTAELDDLAGMD